ncbi:glutamyl-tRNA synthetase [Ophiocordyceps sinensis CO18]|uniref:Glutamyl-tRNA synthetase n=1 Tax=Ophiocordyceps sinensis (strain Co18 / CGMCC 3.14243) TaxID=911162 RepID=T5A8Q6_OPHSC|nr:glutamyl-tRNA synthetase [Ophiocordyceps sinensis CO18]
MATVDIAVQADLALVLPTVVLAEFAQRNQLLLNLASKFHAMPALVDGGSVKCTQPDGQVEGNAVGPERLSVRSKAPSSSHYFVPCLRRADRARLQSIKWISKRASLAGKNFSQLDKALAELDLHLTLRTYIVGFRLDPADLAVWATLRANHIALSIVKNTYKNVLRWYEYVEDSTPWVSKAIAAIANTSTAKRTKERAEASARDARANGNTIPPEPSGYLHIRHAKAALLNDYFAHQKPGGTLICRFDDTNPSNESMEFQDAIVDDLKLMGIVPDKTSFSSDYFQLMYDYAIQLIEDGKAFADDSELGKGDEDRRNRLPSKRRHLGIDETLARFRDMKTGSDEGQRWCLRARIAYDSPNGTCVIPSYTGAT